MALKVLALTDALGSSQREEDIQNLLFSFETITHQHERGAHDVKDFLYSKALQFEKTSLSRTYLIMSTYQEKPYLAGYFSISNSPLVIPKRNYKKLPNTLKKRLTGIGHRTEQENYIIKGYLLGQLGKNYSDIAIKARGATGSDILNLAEEKILEIHHMLGGRIIHLECEDVAKIKEFYTNNGYREIAEYRSENDLCIMVKKIK